MQEQLEKKDFELQHVATPECDADLFTKALRKDQFGHLRDNLQVRKAQQVAAMNAGITDQNYMTVTMAMKSRRVLPTTNGGYKFYMPRDGMNFIGLANLLMLIPLCLV